MTTAWQKTLCILASALAACGIVSAQGKFLGSREKTARPKILGIAGVKVLSTDIPRAHEFYRAAFLGHVGSSDEGECMWCEEMPKPTILKLGSGQILEISVAPKPLPANLLYSVSFVVSDEDEMKHYLAENKIKFKEISVQPPLDEKYLAVDDPEGHHIYFVPEEKNPIQSTGFPRIIHAGFIVKDRAAMDKFYKDVLGFHLYWTGGMKDDVSDWVDMQVPDGTDWIEYMLNVEPNADQRLRGIMDHFAVGVPSVKEATETLKANGGTIEEPPQIGRDGKWQLNLYDPDQTRVELMEFTPVEKPCCSSYTGPHPKP
jgi:catechol 2,3-dioxygenase-like lactoylglutathione lyase family enzyme